MVAHKPVAVALHRVGQTTLFYTPLDQKSVCATVVCLHLAHRVKTPQEYLADYHFLLYTNDGYHLQANENDDADVFLDRVLTLRFPSDF